MDDKDSKTTIQDLQSQIDDLNQSLTKPIGTPSRNASEKSSSTPLIDIPQGTGSLLNADMVDGINANRKAMPNYLVPLGSDGKFPQSTIPASSGGGSGFLLGNGSPTDKNILVADGTLWQSRTMSGDATISADTGTLTLATSGVTAATYGDSTHYPVIAIDAKGRVTLASNQLVNISPGGTDGDIQYKNGSAFNGDDLLFWDNSNKRLGIGTHAPTAPVQIVRGTASVSFTLDDGISPPLTEISITSNNGNNSESVVEMNGIDGTGGLIQVQVWAGGARHAASFGAISNHPIKLVTNNINRAIIDTSGNMGIGVTSPAYLLDVGGDINTTGLFRVSGTQIALANLSDGSTVSVKSSSISHYCGYFRTEAGLTLPTTFFTTTNDSAITIKRITVTPVFASVGVGTGTVYRFTDGSTNCNVTLGPAATSATATFTQNYSASSTLQMKVVSDDNATPPTDINMVVEYIIQ